MGTVYDLPVWNDLIPVTNTITQTMVNEALRLGIMIYRVYGSSNRVQYSFAGTNVAGAKFTVYSDEGLIGLAAYYNGNYQRKYMWASTLDGPLYGNSSMLEGSGIIKSRSNHPVDECVLDYYSNEQAAIDALIASVTYPITYRLTNCTAPSAPTEAEIGNTVIVPFQFTSGYGIVNPSSDVYVTNNGVIIPSTYSNGILTFTMPDPS